MGGDEFIAVLCGKYDISEMNRRARKLAKIEKNVFHKNIVSDKKFHQNITISIGIAQTDGTNKSIDALILESDSQMYQRKSSAE
jgi:diguanylate cyclase (GGDEF)-like protein